MDEHSFSFADHVVVRKFLLNPGKRDAIKMTLFSYICSLSAVRTYAQTCHIYTIGTFSPFRKDN